MTKLDKTDVGIVSALQDNAKLNVKEPSDLLHIQDPSL